MTGGIIVAQCCFPSHPLVKKIYSHDCLLIALASQFHQDYIFSGLALLFRDF
jgi:hypothetical protein